MRSRHRKPASNLTARIIARPQEPDRSEVDQQQKSVPEGSFPAVIGKEAKLAEQQQQDRQNDNGHPDDEGH